MVGKTGRCLYIKYRVKVEFEGRVYVGTEVEGSSTNRRADGCVADDVGDID